MVRRSVYPALVLLVLAITGVACQRIGSTRPFQGRGRGEIAVETSKFRDAIPVEYGDFIGVTTRPDLPGWTQAWFVRPDKTITVVWVNTLSGDIYDKVMTIPRR